MAYNDDAVLSKLSALNESHDSIATAAQWIMFHRRHAERTVQLWLTKLRDLPSQKRLNLIYLANEVVQQSKARQKGEFLREFSPHIAEGTQIAYKGASSDIQAKLRRVIDVWRDRNIFETHVQEAVESRLEELDRARNSAKVGGFSGGAIFTSSSAIPSELSSLVNPQQRVSKGLHPMNNAVKTANSEYEKLTDPTAIVPAPPVYAARLNGLMKTLATAEGAVAEIIKSRRELIGAMEKILSTNREALEAEEASLNELGSRKTSIESKKQEVEFAIIRGMSGNDKEQSPHEAPSGSPIPEPDRPEVEALTPPHVQDHSGLYDDSPRNGEEQPSAMPQPTTLGPQQGGFSSAPGIEILSNLASQYHAVPVNGSNKKRKIGSADDSPDLAGDDGIDADVAEMLRKDIHAQAQK